MRRGGAAAAVVAVAVAAMTMASPVTATMPALAGEALGLDETTTALASVATVADAGAFQVIRREATLTIAAANVSELSRALAELRRRQGWHGRTAVVFEQQAELVPDALGCRITNVRTTLVLTVTLPRLERRGDAADDARDRAAFERLWQASVEGLRRHEDGHVAISIEGARQTHERVAAAAAQRFVDCRAARRMLMREEFRFRHQQTVQHERYDRRTASGARQGAVLRRP